MLLDSLGGTEVVVGVVVVGVEVAEKVQDLGQVRDMVRGMALGMVRDMAMVAILDMEMKGMGHMGHMGHTGVVEVEGEEVVVVGEEAAVQMEPGMVTGLDREVGQGMGLVVE